MESRINGINNWIFDISKTKNFKNFWTKNLEYFSCSDHKNIFKKINNPKFKNPSDQKRFSHSKTMRFLRKIVISKTKNFKKFWTKNLKYFSCSDHKNIFKKINHPKFKKSSDQKRVSHTKSVMF